MDDFLIPYAVQMTSEVGSTDLVIVPSQRSPQSSTGFQHFFPQPGVYMITLAWSGSERATLTTYSNGVWRNPIRIPEGTGQRISAPYIYSGIGVNIRFAVVLGVPATAVESAIVTVIPQEPYKP